MKWLDFQDENMTDTVYIPLWHNSTRILFLKLKSIIDTIMSKRLETGKEPRALVLLFSERTDNWISSAQLLYILHTATACFVCPHPARSK